MSEQPKPGGDAPQQDVPRWGELRERVGDGLAAAREILKDSGSVVAWSRALRADSSALRSDSSALRAESSALRSEARALHGRGWETGDEKTGDAAGDAGGEGMGIEAQTVEAQVAEYAAVVRVLHALDLVTSGPLSQALLSLAGPPSLAAPPSAEDSKSGTQERGWLVAVDLRAAQSVDAAGVRALADGRKALRDAGRRLAVLVLPGSQPARVLEAAGLCRFLPCLESLDEMLDEMLGPEPAEAGGR